MSCADPSLERLEDIRDGVAELTVDLDALGENWRRLARLAAPAACAAAVKADAYGIGIEQAVPALARAGCRTFFTAHVSEGVRARRALRAQRFEGRIFVLNGFHPDIAPLAPYVAFGLAPVIGSAEELAAWLAVVAAADGAEDLACALHVDTGMNRLGLAVDEARLLPLDQLERARLALVMSHLVSAEMPDDGINERQIAGFKRALEGPLARFPASLANSSGIFLPQCPAYDLVRPGYALYGGNPTPGAPNPMGPVVSLQARILQVRTIPGGATAGYNARWTAERPSRLATLALGYADGLPVGASGMGGRGASVYIGDVPCPIVGRVSMDLTIVDVTDVPLDEAGPGATVELLGPHIGVDELGARAGTIGYEILTNLGRRYPRRYVGTGAPSPS